MGNIKFSAMLVEQTGGLTIIDPIDRLIVPLSELFLGLLGSAEHTKITKLRFDRTDLQLCIPAGVRLHGLRSVGRDHLLKCRSVSTETICKPTTHLGLIGVVKCFSNGIEFVAGQERVVEKTLQLINRFGIFSVKEQRSGRRLTCLFTSDGQWNLSFDWPESCVFGGHTSRWKDAVTFTKEFPGSRR